MPRPTRRHRRTYGAVRKLPSGRFQARYRGPDGIERTAPTTFATRDAADEWLSTVRADVLRGDWRAPERGDVLLADYINGWLATRVDLAPRTAALYRRLTDRWLLRRLGTTRHPVDLGRVTVRNFTPQLVRHWYAAVTTEARESVATRAAAAAERAEARLHPARVWAQRTGQDVSAVGRLSPALLAAWADAGSPRTPTAAPVDPPSSAGRTQAAQAYRLLHAILATAVRDGLIEQNPCRVENATVVRRSERRPATVEQVAALANTVPGRYRLALLIAAWSGLRGGELFALARGHVDLPSGSLRVERALVELRGQPLSFGPPKSEAGRRTVHLPAFIVAELRQHLADHVESTPDALLFTTSTGRAIDTAQRQKILAPARAAIGRPDLRWHDLRHTGAVLAAATGASIVELQRRLGHSTPRAALHYQHAADDRDQLLASRLDALAANVDAPLVRDVELTA